MITTRFLNRNSLLAFICAIFVFAINSQIRAQIPPEQAKMAAAIPLTTQLLDKLDKLATTIGADAEAKTQYAAVGKDSTMTPDNAQSVIDSKYPKLAAAFKTAGMTIDEFMKVMTALPITVALAEMADTPEEGTAAANVAFYKANKDRIAATLTKLEGLEK
jgi:hypothetical protein